MASLSDAILHALGYNGIIVDLLHYNMSWTFSKKANSIAVSFNRSKRPDSEKCPAPILHFNNSMLESAFRARSLATHLAGSQYATRGSHRPAVTRICG